MRFLAGSIALSTLPGDTGADAERRRAEAWRELHRRPDALPDPIEPADAVRPYRRFRVTGFVVRRRGTVTGDG
jgi:hypothetical protein